MNKSIMGRRWFGALAASLALSVSALLGGCAAPQATAIDNELPFEQAVLQATEGLVAQTQQLPAFLAKLETKIAKRGVVLDNMIDADSGQQTGVTRLLEQRVTSHMTTKYELFEILPFQGPNLQKAQYLLTGTMNRIPGSRSKKSFRLNLALTELRTGKVVAQASAISRDDGLDTNPTPYYRDSPVLVKDKVIEGYIRTTATAPGQQADRIYLERIATSALVNDATNLYNGERYRDALAQYQSALSTPAGEQLRVLNGIYMSNVKLGRTADAEKAFSRLVAFGVANNLLSVKFLFNPGGTEFWSDQRVSGAYGMWIRQIAREAGAAKVCMNVVGHTSKTGSDQANESLSLQRAQYVKQRLDAESPDLARRTKAVGVGFRENIVGSATDDARDALDRRVEFKIVPCAA
jgi:outer membrane protein OmpA-like peptidoglycan-associated protein